MTAMTPAPQEGQSSGRSGDHATREPAAPGTTPLPAYHATYIACCPECCSDLHDEAFSYWCRACQRSWSFTEVALFDESSIDD